MTILNNTTLASLDGVTKPGYDRSALQAGIVHFGVGGFHRAHQAMYLDDIMNKGESHNMAICGVGVMPSDQKMRDALTDQDGLYTLVIKHPDGQYDARVIGSIIDYLYAPDNIDKVFEVLTRESITIVSLTITEGGYNIDHVTGEFDLANPDIKLDLESQKYTTTFGIITEALKRRRDLGVPPFTIQSCDNIQGNGDVTRKMFISFARAKDEGLGQWIHEYVAFPNAMVDRITPVTTADDIKLVKDQFNIDDKWPVVCEPFTQWVIEDNFPTGRPEWETVGAQMVKDVEPYELMKLRLLNASHQALTYFGYLSGYRYAHEVCQDPDFVCFLMNFMNEESTPTLHPVEGIDLPQYKQTLIERFANPEVKDTLARLCAESSDRIPRWLLPVVREQLAIAKPKIARSAAVVASWARYAEGADEQGNPIEVVDRLKDELMAIASTQNDDPLAFIKNRSIFGDLIDNQTFVDAYLHAFTSLKEHGARETLRSLQ